MMVVRIGLDLAKYVFEVHGVDAQDETVLRKRLRRDAVPQFFAEMPRCVVGMEACCGAHYWAHVLADLGHEVRLVSPQFVTPYVKSNKNDVADAEAICEAVQRPNMRFVSIKTIEQQDIQSLHRIRSVVVATRTKIINQARGLLSEYGIHLPIGAHNLKKNIPLILEDGENGLSGMFREFLSDIYDELCHVNDRIERIDNKIKQIGQQNESAKRLQTIPGIGPMIATALVAAIGSIDNFKNGRELAAWLGLVPRQHSTGGRNQLMGISKRGDVYLRSLMVHGARSVLRFVDKKTDSRSEWLKSILSRRHKNIAAVALANKMARTVYALLSKEQNFSNAATYSIFL